MWPVGDHLALSMGTFMLRCSPLPVRASSSSCVTVLIPGSIGGVCRQGFGTLSDQKAAGKASA